MSSYDSRRFEPGAGLLCGVAAVALWCAAITLGEELPPKLLADRFVVAARTVLTAASTPRQDQLQRAAVLLDLALRHAPADVEIVRLRAELATAMEDGATWQRMMLRYCQLAPMDDAARMALIEAIAKQSQTLEQRAANVRALYADEGSKKLTPALRSRMASYLAQSALERGDTREQALWLQTALELDASNPAAARMAYDVIAARQESAEATTVALLGLIRAAPGDPWARNELAELLYLYGAYAPAAEQYAVAVRLGGQPGAGMMQRWALSLVGAGKSGEALELLEAARKIGFEAGELRGQIERQGSEPAALGLASSVSADGKRVLELVHALGRSFRNPPGQSVEDKPWWAMSIDVNAKHLAMLDPLTAQVRIRNMTDQPLALSRTGPIPTTVLLFVDAQVGLSEAVRLEPIVVDMGRRLRLEPRETVEVAVRLDRGPLGVLLAGAPLADVRFAVAGVLDPVAQADGTIVSRHPRSTDVEDRTPPRRGALPDENGVLTWLGAMEKDSESAAGLRAMASVLYLLSQPQPAASISSRRDDVTARVMAAYNGMSAAGQAWVVTVMPAEGAAALPGLHHAASHSDDPSIRVAYLATQVKEAGSPAVEQALQHADPMIETFARNLQESLRLAGP